ncbi:lysosomal alpha-mannosidase [Dermacentor silvarum]|uniref:lysosomal alpha-mannosidase n=1 Tax=Dermacentor silvarum TaxID=543639 RepID=UPI002101D0AA|nr:lysosomal alpha-mannosidase [Dermacentor silvarum]
MPNHILPNRTGLSRGKRRGDGGHIFAWVPENTYVNPGHISFGSEYCMYSEESYEFQDTRIPNLLLTYAERQTEMYTNDTVAMMSGGDLAFTRGDCRFQKQDAFITTANRISQAMQQRTPVYVVHSTPACYIEALRAKSRTWPRYSGDLLPYTDMPGRTWTGFYTTRPSQKMLVRYANGFLQRLVSTTLVSLLDPGILRTDELAKRLGFCHLLNQSDCKHTTANNKAPQFGVVIYNPASARVSPYVRLPLSTGDSVVLSVTGPGGTKVESQVVPLAPHRHKIPERQGMAESSLVFQANVQPLGASIYHVKSGKVTTKKLRNFLEIHEQDNYIENERYRVEIEPGTGLVSTIVLRQPQASVKLHQSFGAYAYGDDSPEQVRSPGHYVFSAYSEARAMGDQVIHRVVKGPVVQEIHQIFNDYISQVISLQKNSPFIEFTWTVGPLTKLMASTGWAKKSGCDVVSQFESNLNSSEFYTDSNGWKNMRRIRTLQSYALPIPSNYYPVTSWIYIKDRIKGLQMMILPDRPQGGSSLRSGQLELMVHRRHNTNDNLGVGEVLQETGSDGAGLVAKGTHRLFLGSIAEAGPLLRPQALQLVYRPLLVFAPAGWRPKNEKFTGLRAPLPSTVHVLTLERLSANQVLLRLEHLAVTKAIVMLNVTRLLTGHLLKDLQPVTLAANQFLSNATRQHWPTGRFGQQRPQVESVRMIAPEIMTVPSTGDNVVRLKPRQIVTFLATLVDE